jgi:acyl dehydratase
MSAIPSNWSATRWFEDYNIGLVLEFGRIVADETEILDFGRRFDPQVFHVDAEAAKQSSFGGLVASGWHTAGMAMRLLVEHYISPVASMGSPGVDELRWYEPVRPGDVLSLRVTISGSRQSRTKPDRGIVNSLVEVINQHGRTAMSFKAMTLFRCRPAT